MKRDLALFEGRTFDLAVLGGGVHGAALAREAALRGLEVALLEKDDFGGATSANSLKVIHGGLRYLQHGDLRRVRESQRARRAWQLFAPGLVRPLPCVMPTFRGRGPSRLLLGGALAANDLVGWDRNRGLGGEEQVPPGRLLSPEDLLRLLPGRPRKGLTGGGLWFDALAGDTERLTLSLVLSAAERGAAVANYLKAERIVVEGNRVAGVEGRDRFTGDLIFLRARVVADATGPWVHSLRPSGGGAAAPPAWAAGTNLVVRRPLVGECAAGLGDKEQVHFFVPWRGGTLAGTWYWRHEGGPGEAKAGPRELERMVRRVNALLPEARLEPGEVSLVHLGLLPLASAGADPLKGLRRHTRIADCSLEGGPEGLIALEGVKYTTAPTVAAAALALCARLLGRSLPPPAPESGLLRPTDAAGAALPAAMAHLGPRYGGRAADVAALAALAPPLAQPLSGGCETTGAELVHALRSEMALTLADLVLRRTPLGGLGHPGPETLSRCADLAAVEMGWDGRRREEEIAGLSSLLDPPRG